MPNLTLDLILYGSIALIITFIAMALAYTILSDPEARRQIPQVGLLPWVGSRLEAGGQWVSDWITRIVIFLIGPGDHNEADGDRLYRKLTIISVITSLFLFAISFRGSFAAGWEFAFKNGIDQSVAKWIPVSIDGGIGLMILTIFACSYVGRKCGLIKLAVLVLTGVSIMFNVAHISQGSQADFIHYLLGAIFPLMVFVSSEVTSFQIKGYIDRKRDIQTNARLKGEIDTLTGQLDALEGEIESERLRLQTEAEAATRAHLEQLEQQRADLAAEIESAEGKLQRLEKKIEEAEGQLFTAEDLKAAYALGQNPKLSGANVGEIYGVGQSQGTAKKKAVVNALNGSYS